MKIKTVLLVIILCIIGFTSAQAEKITGNNKIVTKEIKVGNYETIEIGHGIEMNDKSWISSGEKSPTFYYSQSKGESTLKITIDENLLQHLDIQTSNGKLTIKANQQRKRLAVSQMTIKASSPNLKKVIASGCIDFKLESKLTGDELEIIASGASDVYMNQAVQMEKSSIIVSGSGDFHADNFHTTSIKLAVSGSGDIRLKGDALQAKFAASGSGDIHAYDFKVEELDCSVSGSSDIKTYVIKTLNASASGSGDINYKGDPSVRSSTSGSSDIRKVS